MEPDTGRSGEASTEPAAPGPPARRPGPDVVVSRDGATLEVSITRRGIHRVGTIVAIAISAWVVWAAIRPSSPKYAAPDTPPVATVAIAPTEETHQQAAPSETAVSQRIPLTIVPAPTLVAPPTASPTGATVTQVPAVALPVGVGYVGSVDGNTTDLRFPWDGPSPSSTGNWAIEVWLRPTTSRSGTIYAESGAALGAQTTRVLWIDGADIWASGFASQGSPDVYVARGAANWPAATWHHLGVSWSGGVPMVVADGGTEAMVAAPRSDVARSQTSDRVVGHLFPIGPSGGFAGEFDDVRLWSTSRGARQIGDGYQQRVATTVPGLARYFPVSVFGGAGATLADATGQGRPLQFITGARWAAIGEPPVVVTETEVALASVEPTATPTTSVDISNSRMTVTADFASPVLSDWVFSGGARPIADGWVRLTDASPMQLGIARYERDLAVTAGLSIRYAYRLTSGTGPAADGMVAFLWDPNSGPFVAGYGGGSLGYGRYCKTGLSGAILGVGLDAYGTFGSSEPTCNDVPKRLAPNALSVRGRGSGTTGYGLITTTPLRRRLTGMPGTESVVSVTVNLFADGTLSVLTQYESESVPTEEISRVLVMPAGTSMPATARVGFAAATGGLYASHDLRDVSFSLGGE